jgi:hypothetical protein
MIGLSLLSSVSKHTMWSYYDCIYFCFRSSVNTICGRIMNGLLLSSVSKHNMWSCYDWVVVVVFRLLTQYETKTKINTIIIRPHCMFTDRRQQRQPNHNTTSYCVY